MATSDINVCSQALGLLGAASISSFTDGSNEADACALLYPSFVRRILTMNAWSFATKFRQLSRDSSSPTTQYKYAYSLPAEAIGVVAIFDSNSVGAKPVTNYGELKSHNGSTQVLTSLEKVYAEINVYTTETLWPGSFEFFAVRALAAELAMPVTDNETLANYWNRIAYGQPDEGGRGGLFSTTALTDDQQSSSEEIENNALIAARFG